MRKIYYFSPNVDWEEIGSTHPEWLRDNDDYEVNPNYLTEEQCEILMEEIGHYDAWTYTDFLEFESNFNCDCLSDEGYIRIF